jgi:phosphatidylglycerophosphate synthase
MELTPGEARRPLRTRERRWARSLAAWLAARRVRPNAVSLASVVFAAAAGVCLALSPQPGGEACVPLLLGAAACVQLRLLCNMVDGLIAVEGGLKGPLGEIYNDLPDRIADALILIGAGLAVRSMRGGVTLGWLAALLASLTAYVRLLGGSLGLPQSFAGPMAKQHRMFVVTVSCLTASVESLLGRPPRTLYFAIVLIAIGSAVTAARRALAIARALRSR